MITVKVDHWCKACKVMYDSWSLSSKTNLVLRLGGTLPKGEPRQEKFFPTKCPSCGHVMQGSPVYSFDEKLNVDKLVRAIELS